MRHQLPSVGAGNVLHDLIDCGHFKTVRLLEKDKTFPAEIKIDGAKEGVVELAAKEDLTVLEKRGEKGAYELRFTLNAGIKAPVSAGLEIGVVELIDKNTGETLGKTAILTMSDINRRTLLDGIGTIFDNWFFGI